MHDGPRLTSLVFRLSREKLGSLKELSRATRIRQSEYLREAIDDLLVKYEDSFDS
ncbi:MAG: ribbon-helix-helix domain-containing protein [Myxococcales bacterium]|nr:ribbon-helix-helix domain-containing protein [Myxococcales bacterium]